MKRARSDANLVVPTKIAPNLTGSLEIIESDVDSMQSNELPVKSSYKKIEVKMSTSKNTRSSVYLPKLASRDVSPQAKGLKTNEGFGIKQKLNRVISLGREEVALSIALNQRGSLSVGLRAANKYDKSKVPRANRFRLRQQDHRNSEQIKYRSAALSQTPKEQHTCPESGAPLRLLRAKYKED